MRKSLLLSLILQLSILTFSFSAFAQVASESEMLTPKKVGNEIMLPVQAEDILPGTYQLETASSSSMFRITEAVLSVVQNEDGSCSMQAEITLGGKSYTKLFPGSALEASEAEGKGEIYFSEKADGSYAYIFPVSALNVPLKCAAFSKRKNKWYDRDILFDASSLPQEALLVSPQKPEKVALKNGTYRLNVTLTGGSGRASITSPAYITVKDGFANAEIEWSSSNYDYMKVNRQKYEVDSKILGKGGNSTFVIPVYSFDKKMPVTADTVAMSKNHEIHYWLEFNLKSAKKARKKK